LAFALLQVLGLLQIAPAQTADTIYEGGDILTMEGKSPKYVRRLAVERAI
jgi:hypothetical protein